MMSIRPIVIVAACLAVPAWIGTGAAGPGPGADSPAASTALAATAGGGQDSGEFVPVDDMPKPVKKVPPRYPKAARKRGQEGTVEVMALVAKDGKVARVKVAKGKGVAADLDAAAAAAVRQWVFTPAMAEGKPVAVWVVVPVKFRLH